MGIFRGRTGYQRWKCHSCGEGGTAVDLFMAASGVGAGEALRELARRSGLLPWDAGGFRRSTTPTIRRVPPPPAAPPTTVREPDPAVETFVARGAALLWQPIGSGARQHLSGRGFTDEVLHANRVGFDPGPRQLARPRGLPFRGPGIVYPALDPISRSAVYYQVRYLDPERAGRKYDQPAAALAPNPRLAAIRSTVPAPAGYLVVCEGFPDALTASQAGVAAIAVLGVSHASTDGAETLAQTLLERYPRTAFAICFDADDRGTRPGKPATGRIAAGRLADRLAQTGAIVARLEPAAPHKDLNDWWRADPVSVTRELSGTATVLVPVVPVGPDVAALRSIGSSLSLQPFGPDLIG